MIAIFSKDADIASKVSEYSFDSYSVRFKIEPTSNKRTESARKVSVAMRYLSSLDFKMMEPYTSIIDVLPSLYMKLSFCS